MRGGGAEEVLTLLDQQRAALIAGDLAGLDGLDRSIESALSHLSKSTPGADKLAALRTSANRNAALIRAAQAGLRQAQTVLRQAATVKPLATYSAEGHKAETNGDAARVLKRI